MHHYCDPVPDLSMICVQDGKSIIMGLCVCDFITAFKHDFIRGVLKGSRLPKKTVKNLFDWTNGR